MLLIIIVFTSSILLSCSPSTSTGEKVLDDVEKDTTEQDDVKPEERLLMVNGKLYCGTAETGPMGDAGAVEGKINSVSKAGTIPNQNGQSNFGGIGSSYTQDYGDGFIMVMIEDEWFCFNEQRGSEIEDKEEEPFEKSKEKDIPWGFDAVSYEIYKSGALDSFITTGNEVEQCLSADLDMDGIDDVLLSCTILDSNNSEDNQDDGLNTLILKGMESGAYKLEAENQNVNYCSSYDGSAELSAGDGWFKLTRSRGTGGGYVYSYFFEYNQDKKDWFLNTYYYNQFGYIEEGRSVVQSPENFGSIPFTEFNSSIVESTEEREGAASEEELSVSETDFIISVRTCYVTLEDKKKEYKINKMITDHLTSMIDQFRELDTSVDMMIQGKITYETPQIICIEYSFLGTLDGDEMNYSGYITAMFDIEEARQITLSEIIDIEKLYSIMKQEGIVYRSWDSDTTWKQFNDMKQEECLELLKTSDDMQTAFGAQNTGIFSAIYEKSLCLYFQPEFIGMGPYCEPPMIYIPIKDILSDITLNYWELPEEKISRIEWMG